MKTTTREMIPADAERVVDYFSNADVAYLKGMGADKSKLPAREEWIAAIQAELNKPFEEKQLYYVIWEVDGKAIGHSNINHITLGQEAYMHLHIWEKENRRFGHGLELVKQSIPKYFEHFQLQKLRCEPFAGNTAPVHLLEQAGFEFVEIYETTPSIICFPQEVRRFEMSKTRFLNLDHFQTK
ncbi:Protein N-acetyltransferase, RimJ/RimL family [Reichenbachiella faecimaris]|uniref:Protein N-acetyltransferase, RimJ/RimL family n=1 Tax=Reichenbachiella faecimaris TaxID=692418 RepID=A0A1W2G9A2_REIFA|nr:GNAT family protein [Reichenbachiella faecimaris]SMD33270.1 Protein N-acetyltransferase, RimJ/RimL family [Reichenbachiella faecimaris]